MFESKGRHANNKKWREKNPVRKTDSRIYQPSWNFEEGQQAAPMHFRRSTACFGGFENAIVSRLANKMRKFEKNEVMKWCLCRIREFTKAQLGQNSRIDSRAEKPVREYSELASSNQPIVYLKWCWLWLPSKGWGRSLLSPSLLRRVHSWAHLRLENQKMLSLRQNHVIWSLCAWK
jgi:hypothetical protein